MSVEQALKRPLNYPKLSSEEQWAIDKALGILDWDPKPEEVELYKAQRKARYEEMEGVIKVFAQAPESQMDSYLAKECEDWDGEDPVRFIRDLRDKCVHSGSSEFAIRALSFALRHEPEEPQEAREARHEALRAQGYR